VHALPLIPRVSWHAMPCDARAARPCTPPSGFEAGRPVAERCQSPPGKAARGPRLPPEARARPGQAPACALTPPLAASRWSTPTSMAERERPAGTRLAFFSSSVRWPVSLVSFDVVWKQVKLSERAGPCRSTGRQLLPLVCAWRLTACTSIILRRLFNRISGQWSLNLILTSIS
jgi:hypothetical protein